MIPGPPLDELGMMRVTDPEIHAQLHRGSAGICVMCQDCTWSWWDLTLCDMPPVTDRHGTLTDQVPLHPRCVGAVVDYWASLLFEDSGAALAVTPDMAGTPGAGVRSTRPRVGAYARQGTT